jgi:hypothetical protein
MAARPGESVIVVRAFRTQLERATYETKRIVEVVTDEPRVRETD